MALLLYAVTAAATVGLLVIVGFAIVAAARFVWETPWRRQLLLAARSRRAWRWPGPAHDYLGADWLVLILFVICRD